MGLRRVGVTRLLGRAGGFVAVAAALLASPAVAQECLWGCPDPAQRGADTRADEHRRYGLGTALGGGAAAAFSATQLTIGRVMPTNAPAFAGPIVPALLLPSFEVRFLLRRGHSIDLSVPLVNSVLASILTRSFVAGVDAFYDFSLDGAEDLELHLAPGLGLHAVLGSPYNIVELRVPLAVGVEYLTGRGLGLGLQARPFLNVNLVDNVYVPDCPFGCGGRDVRATHWITTEVGAGVVGLLTVTWYSTTR